MSHQELQKVPGHTRLHRRGSKYYIRAKVPVDIQETLKRKEYKHALKTSDYAEAVKRVKVESIKLDALFEKARQSVHHGAQIKTPLPSIDEGQAFNLIVQWFLKEEAKSEEWFDKQFRTLDQAEKKEILVSLQEEEAIYTGQHESYQPQDGDGTSELKSILTEHGFDTDTKSPLFNKLAALIRKARVENFRRSIQRVTGEAPTHHDNRVWQFVERPVSAAQPKQQPSSSMLLGKLLQNLESDLVNANRSAATLRAYALPYRILKEQLGDNMPLESISREHIESIRDFLKTIPANATQRFKGKTLAQAAREAETKLGIKRLDERTALNYFNTIICIFNYAVKRGLLARNPANDQWLKSSFKTRKKQKAQFTSEELNKIFKAPLYTGCEDDENGFAKRGTFKGRRGRFWVPLLALFHGLRSNEACQLYTEDVTEKEGIPCILIRESVDDGSSTEKSLKTASSERVIPIHDELIKMGFLDYVKRRRLYKNEPRLFPELPKGKAGKFSDPLQKWFSRFLIHSLGAKPQATFHSFRHMFRDALRDAETHTEIVEALGGWKKERSAEAGYGRGFKMKTLKTALDKVAYADLSLAHLHTSSCRLET